MTQKTYEVSLSYFKKGDDLGYARDNSSGDAEALSLHARMLKDSAETLDILSALALQDKLTIEEADTHMILVSVDDDVADGLLEDGRIMSSDWMEEDEDDFCDCEDCLLDRCEEEYDTDETD